MGDAATDLTSIDWQQTWADPYPTYRRLRAQTPVFYDAPSNTYLVTRYQDVWDVLIDAERFSNVPFHLVDNPEARISTLRNSDPPRHTWIRQIVAPLFIPKAMRQLQPYFDALADELLDKAEVSDVVEVSTQLAIPLPGRVTCDLLGVPREHHKKFLDLTAERLSLLSSQSQQTHTEGARGFEAVRADLWAIVQPIAAERMRDPKNDAITLCFQAQERIGRDQLSDNLIVDLLLQLLTGGFHTTQLLLELFLNLLADRDDLWQRLRADPTLVPKAVDEMLRYDAPVQALPRYAYAEQEVSGVKIPAMSNLLMVYGSANRDETAFPEPDSFSLDRKINRHMTFSAGIHNCPGAPVTRFEVKALIEKMLQRYKTIERAGPSVRMAIQKPSAAAMHGYSSVPVRLIRA